MEQNSNNPDSELVYGFECPYIELQWKGRIFVSSAVFRLIGESGGIRILWNQSKKSLLIAPTTIEDPDGIPLIGVTYEKRRTFYAGSRTLTHEIWKSMGWDSTLRFRVVAKYNEPSNVAIFEMNEAIIFEMPKKEKNDSK